MLCYFDFGFSVSRKISEKEESGGDCAEDDDEWRDLIATPNRLISNDFFVLKSIKLDEREEDFEKGNDGSSPEDRDRVHSIRVSVSSSRVTVWPPILKIHCGISPTSLLDSLVLIPNSQASPTTGSFQYPLFLNQEILGMKSEHDDMILMFTNVY
uniref:Uncharacterized protein n=1 Tax=Lactuca sativa TaxID=4236 RepID=A0A9R1VQ86_LACSA|nr:hypothetical protein LSAT_V11C400207980 [Lactuca sativa]